MVNAVGNVQLMQRLNRIKVLGYIRKNIRVSRNEIAVETNLSLSSITNIVNYLLEKKLVFEVGRLDAEGAGRRATLLEFNAAAKQIVSVNIEPGEIRVALTDLKGGIISSTRIAIEGEKYASEILAVVELEISKFKTKSELVTAIGISISGHVSSSGIVNSSIMRWKAVDVKSRLEDTFSLPVYVSNNSKTKALWEFNANKNKKKSNIVFLDLVQGVGIISYFEGKINEAVMGELGHTTVMKNGPQCFCGNRGCLELVCSEDYVVSQYNKKTQKPIKGLDGLLDALNRSDDTAKMILKECAEYLGIGIANIISLFEPEMIIINKNNLISCPFVYDTALQEAKARGYNLTSKEVEFERVSITDEQAIQGMAQYVADRICAFDGSAL